MRVIYLGLDTVKKINTPMCACIGYFDGMHRGHQQLVKATIEMSRKYHCDSAMITFEPDPWVTVRGAQHVRHISTLRERMNKAVALGIQNIIILRFTREMSELAPAAFVDKVLGKLNLKGLVCGFDFHYGYMGKGSSKTLEQQADFEVQVIPEIDDSIGKISSTRISACIEKGEMEEAAEMLGSYFSIEGVVVHGDHAGTGLGFPTANIKYSDEYLLPRPGVYAGYATIDGKRYKTMVNLGHNPTLNYKKNLSLEAYLFGFKGDAYGRYCRIEFVHYMRHEMQFRNKENLIMQLEQDRRDVMKVLDNDQ